MPYKLLFSEQNDIVILKPTSVTLKFGGKI